MRLGEHKQAVRRGDPNNGITIHAHEPCMRLTGTVLELRVIHLNTVRENHGSHTD